MSSRTPSTACSKAQLNGNKNNFAKLSFQANLARCPSIHTRPETGTIYPRNVFKFAINGDISEHDLFVTYLRNVQRIRDDLLDDALWSM